MKTIEVGKYLIRVISKQDNIIWLEEGNILAITNGEIVLFDAALNIEQYDAVFYIHLLENGAELGVIFDKESHENKNRIFQVHVGKSFTISTIQCEIIFECAEDSLTETIHAFKENRLIGDYDIKSILMQYAKVNGITERQAVCYIVTTIDVPEVEEGTAK